MIVSVSVSPQESIKREFAAVKLECRTYNLSSTISIDFSTLQNKCNPPNEKSVDFLFVSAVIYCADKLIPRDLSLDKWTRTLQIEIPVSDPGLTEFKHVRLSRRGIQ